MARSHQRGRGEDSWDEKTGRDRIRERGPCLEVMISERMEEREEEEVRRREGRKENEAQEKFLVD